MQTYFPHCWQYLLLSPSIKTQLAFAQRKQTLCLLWYPLSSLISTSQPGTWHLAVEGRVVVLGRFFHGAPLSSSSSFSSISGHAHGIRPARKLEQVNLGSRFRIRSGPPESDDSPGGAVCSGVSELEGMIWSGSRERENCSSAVKSRSSFQSHRLIEEGSSTAVDAGLSSITGFSRRESAPVGGSPGGGICIRGKVEF